MPPIFLERAADGPAVEALLDRTFGPGRLDKTVYRLREHVAPLAELCFLSYGPGGIDGTIRFWAVAIDDVEPLPALLLGPVAVAPERQGRGLGRRLVRHGLARAAALGHGGVLLVGDPAYYGRFGFRRPPAAGLVLPGPVEPARVLGLELVPGYLAAAAGPVGQRPSRRQASISRPSASSSTRSAGSSGTCSTPVTR